MKRYFNYSTAMAWVLMIMFSLSGCGDDENGISPDNQPHSTVTDIDGNVYETVKIGDQWWMMENLKVTHYRNDDPIPNVTETGAWTTLSTEAYCSHSNDAAVAAVYGQLYNWFAVNDSRNIAPEGWHVPTDDEWKQLEMYLGMSLDVVNGTGWRGTDEAGKLKEADTTHWVSPNISATNESGFTALPAGFRRDEGGFADMGHSTHFWSSTEHDVSFAWARSLYNDHSDIGRYDGHGKQYGFSVRCVKD